MATAALLLYSVAFDELKRQARSTPTYIFTYVTALSCMHHLCSGFRFVSRSTARVYVRGAEGYLQSRTMV